MIDRSSEFDIRFKQLDKDFIMLNKQMKELEREIKKLENETDKRIEKSKNNEISDKKLLVLTIDGKKNKVK